MRLQALKESAPGKKGITTLADARVWLEACEDGSASEQDKELYKKLVTALKTFDKLGGKTTVYNVLRAMMTTKR